MPETIFLTEYSVKHKKTEIAAFRQIPYMPLRIRELTNESGYTLAPVEWKDIRRHFIAERTRRGTQAQVAGVKQSTISKLESNTNLGPQVETFVKAVEGLGLPVSEFFRELESAPTLLQRKDSAQKAAQNVTSTTHETKAPNSADIPESDETELAHLKSLLGPFIAQELDAALARRSTSSDRGRKARHVSRTATAHRPRSRKGGRK